MGADLVPIVDGFFISHETFNAGDHSIDDGCITAGTHKVMRFNFKSYNIGNADLVIGPPASHPEWFVWSASHNHFHLKDFNEFILYNINGIQATKGYKQAFCLENIDNISGNFADASKYSCSNQGVSKGWADVYNSGLPCQFIVIDGIPDGDYTLKSTTNQLHFFPEDTYDNNTICTGLRIAGDTVTVTDPPSKIDLATAAVIFNDVPEGETTFRPVIFNVIGCIEVHFEITDGPKRLTGPVASTFSAPAGNTLTISHLHDPVMQSGNLWIAFTGTSSGDMATGSVTVKCTETGQTWVVPIQTNTIHRPTVAVQFALDQSGSMAWAAGTSGALRVQVLKDAANLFVNLIPKNNAIGIIRFDQDAYPPNDPTYGGMVLTKIHTDSFADPARITALNAIANQGTHGETSIGDGLEMAHNQLNTLPIGSYDQKAILLFTDGVENSPKSIADVSGLIDDRVFAVGLGNESQVNTPALTALAGSTGGYLLLSGLLSSSINDQFRLRKFFLQILAGVTNTSIVMDPTGYINIGTQVKIPFELTEADIDCRVILLTDFPVIKLSVETPDGKIIDESTAATFGVTFDTAHNIKTSRFNLPIAFKTEKIQAGTWYAVLEVNRDLYKKLLSGNNADTHEMGWNSFSGLRSKGAKYCVSIHSFSNLKMNAAVSQNGFIPGSVFSLRASLAEYDLPVEKRAEVKAEIRYPDNSNIIISLHETEPGIFQASISATVPGIYNFRVLANGRTYKGIPFRREQLVTTAVYYGGDHPSSSVPGSHELCQLIKCLLQDKGIQTYLKEKNINAKTIYECLCKNEKYNKLNS